MDGNTNYSYMLINIIVYQVAVCVSVIIMFIIY